MTKRDYPKLHHTLAKNVRICRHSIGYSQQELAEKAGLSTNFVAQIEQGRRFPSAAVIERLSECLGVRPYQLFYDDVPLDSINREQAIKVGQWLAESLTTRITSLVDQYVKTVQDPDASEVTDSGHPER